MEKAIENNVNIANPFEIQNNQAVDLFNGNISAMNTMNAGLRNLGSQTKFQYSQVYRYDLFNRLVSAQTYELDQSQAWTSTDKWLSNYKYDLNKEVELMINFIISMK